MFKKILFTLFIPLLAISCGGKEEEKEKNTTDKVVVTPVSDIIIGIGKIVPEQQQ